MRTNCLTEPPDAQVPKTVTLLGMELTECFHDTLNFDGMELEDPDVESGAESMVALCLPRGASWRVSVTKTLSVMRHWHAIASREHCANIRVPHRPYLCSAEWVAGGKRGRERRHMGTVPFPRRASTV